MVKSSCICRMQQGLWLGPAPGSPGRGAAAESKPSAEDPETAAGEGAAAPPVTWSVGVNHLLADLEMDGNSPGNGWKWKITI